MSFTARLRRPLSLLPLIMSAAALGLVLGYLAIFGVTHEPDEGAAAHVYQLLIGGQVPIIGLGFVTTWLRAPRAAVQMAALQIVAILVTFVPLAYFGL